MRASRLLSIMILLQVRSRVTAEALATEFEVSVRTIYRDIDELSAAGIPIHSERGPHGGFQLIEGFRSQLTGFENEEAEALLLVGLPGPAIALGMGNAATLASRKLMASLPPSLREGSSRIAACFHLDTNDWYRAQPSTPALPRIARAVLDQKPIQVKYQSWSSVRSWQMEPLGLVLKAGGWYLVANGQSRSGSVKKIGIFNVANISGLEILEERFTRPKDFDLALFWDHATTQFEARLRPKVAQLRATTIGLARIAKLGAFAANAVDALRPPHPPEQTDSAQTPVWRLIDLPYETTEQAALMLLAIGAECEVIAPIELRQQLKELALQCYQLHSRATKHKRRA